MKYKRLLFAYSGASVGGLLAFILGIGCIIVLRNIMSRARPAVAKIENDLLITSSSANPGSHNCEFDLKNAVASSGRSWIDALELATGLSWIVCGLGFAMMIMGLHMTSRARSFHRASGSSDADSVSSTP